jgi:hypothetical protein
MSLCVNSLISLRLGVEDCLAVIHELQSDEVLGQKKRQHPGALPFITLLFLINQPQPPSLLQDEHADAGPKSMPELILKPYPRKSTVTGLAFS